MDIVNPEEPMKGSNAQTEKPGQEGSSISPKEPISQNSNIQQELSSSYGAWMIASSRRQKKFQKNQNQKSQKDGDNLSKKSEGGGKSVQVNGSRFSALLGNISSETDNAENSAEQIAKKKPSSSNDLSINHSKDKFVPKVNPASGNQSLKYGNLNVSPIQVSSKPIQYLHKTGNGDLSLSHSSKITNQTPNDNLNSNSPVNSMDCQYSANSAIPNSNLIQVSATSRQDCSKLENSSASPKVSFIQTIMQNLSIPATDIVPKDATPSTGSLIKFPKGRNKEVCILTQKKDQIKDKGGVIKKSFKNKSGHSSSLKIHPSLINPSSPEKESGLQVNPLITLPPIASSSDKSVSNIQIGEISLFKDKAQADQPIPSNVAPVASQQIWISNLILGP